MLLVIITYPFSLKLLLFFISLFVFVKIHNTHLRTVLFSTDFIIVYKNSCCFPTRYYAGRLRNDGFGSEQKRAWNCRPKLLSRIRVDCILHYTYVIRVCWTHIRIIIIKSWKRAFQTVEPNSTCQILPRDTTLISSPNNNIR